MCIYKKDYVWSAKYGRCMEYGFTLIQYMRFLTCMWNKNGICMEYVRNIYGIYMECV